MTISSLLRSAMQWTLRPQPFSPGLYRYSREADGTIAQFHLRIDQAGDGLLLANAAAVARLSASGVLIAKGLLEGSDVAEITRRLKKQFRGAREGQITSDIATVRALIERMTVPTRSYPILNLADPAFSPKVAPLGRPISADVPLCAPFHSARVLTRLWELGIPHATFIVGPEPNAEHLVRAVEKAGDLGMISGVRGRGSELAVGTLINDIAAAGLDHLDVYCTSTVDKIHDALVGQGDAKMVNRALRSALANEVCAVAQLALVRPTLPTLLPTLELLARYGIENVAVFAIATTDPKQAEAGAILAQEIVPAGRQIVEAAERFGLRLTWYPSVQFDPAHSLGAQVCRGPRCSGDVAIRVDPDGSVFAPRGPYLPAGNLFEDDWETIYHGEPFETYRRRVESDTHCGQCPGLTICAADCPREPAGWAMPPSATAGT